MIVFYIFTTLLFHSCYGYTPIVMWHGMGDSCCSEGSLGKIIDLIQSEMPNVTVLSLKFGNSEFEDRESSFFGDANTQVAKACDLIASDPEFQNGYNAIGFSQGGQFLRAVAQRCPSPPMKTLVSLGGQHQGVYGIPRCPQPEPGYCDYIRRLLNSGAYIGWIQNSLIQAQYWHDPLDEATYSNYSIFLADINNEKPIINESYSTNLQQLEHLVLVMFSEDSMVAPRESSWFGFYAPGQAETVLPLEETNVFSKNTIGLQELKRDGKLELIQVPGDHLHFTHEWFVSEIVRRYLV